MPTYLVTDKHTDTRIMVEAQRPQGALSVLIADRFHISPALEAAEAIRYTRDGVTFIDEGEAAPQPSPGTPEPQSERPPLGAFGEVAVSGWGADDGAAEPSFSGVSLPADGEDE